jgi:peptidoglycan hydrolase-like protein with peptidoglycan-binding domain
VEVLAEDLGPQLKLTTSEIQQALHDLEYYNDAIDGTLSASLAGAVKKFQAAWGLDVDGTAGKDTQRLLAYLDAQTDTSGAGLTS